MRSATWEAESRRAGVAPPSPTFSPRPKGEGTQGAKWVTGEANGRVGCRGRVAALVDDPQSSVRVDAGQHGSSLAPQNRRNLELRPTRYSCTAVRKYNLALIIKISLAASTANQQQIHPPRLQRRSVAALRWLCCEQASPCEPYRRIKLWQFARCCIIATCPASPHRSRTPPRLPNLGLGRRADHKRPCE